MKENLKYETPDVEIIEIEVEKGFAASEPDAGGSVPDAGWGN